jgi:hypothetical protein
MPIFLGELSKSLKIHFLIVYIPKISIVHNLQRITRFGNLPKTTISPYTHDEDFEKLLLLNGVPPKVIVLKTFNQNTKQLAQTLIDKKATIESFIVNNELMILEIY